jgi:hypothetical protein
VLLNLFFLCQMGVATACLLYTVGHFVSHSAEVDLGKNIKDLGILSTPPPL